MQAVSNGGNKSENSDAPRFLAAGDTALVVQFGEDVDREINRKVIALATKLREQGVAGIVDLVPTFRSLMIHYDPLVIGGSDLRERVAATLDGLTATEISGRLWRVPVLYGGDAGPDLAEVAERCGLTEQRVVDLHGSVTYEVYMMGFLPGLGYLGILPKELELPRRSDPRVRVPARSVAIAINQTNIYSMESPGGWHLLGRTPVEVFDRGLEDPILLAAGDRIEFFAIDQDANDSLRRRIEAGEYHLSAEEVQ
jgi:KipI family sensor histidine kinase inhibitor